MKRWRVVQFTTVDEAESYLNGLSLQPDQIKGLFAKTPTATDRTGGMVLVCWLNAQQQRIEELQRRPLGDEDSTRLASTELALWEPEDEAPREEPRARRRRGDDEEVGA